MTNFRIERIPFDGDALDAWGRADDRHTNWPVVYTINDKKQIYVGETTNPVRRLLQHKANPDRSTLQRARIILGETFNKSVCLDLESHLIQYFHADEQYQVQNKNLGLSDADYFDREKYRESFQDIFDDLLKEGVLTRSIPDLENTDLFKFSPFKALTADQAVAVDAIVNLLLTDLRNEDEASIVVRGEPGTGKTVVAVYLMKLLMDIATSRPDELLDQDTMFADLFEGDQREVLKDLRIGLVIPQQSLRKTLERVFRQTPGLHKSMIMSPFQVGKVTEPYDVLIVDEAHRLSQRARMPGPALNADYRKININLFGEDLDHYTQLDWIRARSAHQILLLDALQSVRPSDLPAALLKETVTEARKTDRLFHLHSQMRVKAESDYVGFIDALLRGEATEIPDFGDYDFRIFDNLADMRAEILRKDEEVGLSRLVAGYAWEWKSKDDPEAFDIELDGVQLRWNTTATDWINSPTSVDEVGSIHTVQGYDLNYAGVIIGDDLGYDQETGRFFFNRDAYFDKRGKENNARLGITYSDDDLLEYVRNIYRVLLTRGIRGTFLLQPRKWHGAKRAVSML
ncbi:MAG: Uncharacterised protein [Cellulomonadaceae bacterium TMED98]|nr:MAG: Uncharacterised protein [Cellulomonadaceae bacterium TMED98]